MADKRWKKWEREVAKVLGGIRIPTSGSAQFPGEEGDVYHPKFEIECKDRTKMETVTWFMEVVGRAKKSGKIPILALKRKGQRGGKLVVLRIEDFLALTKTGR